MTFLPWSWHWRPWHHRHVLLIFSLLGAAFFSHFSIFFLFRLSWRHFARTINKQFSAVNFNTLFFLSFVSSSTSYLGDFESCTQLIHPNSSESQRVSMLELIKVCWRFSIMKERRKKKDCLTQFTKSAKHLLFSWSLQWGKIMLRTGKKYAEEIHRG